MFLRFPSASSAMAVTAFLAVVALVSAQSPCTSTPGPNACPPGPVRAIFENANCSGAVTFVTVTHQEYGACEFVSLSSGYQRFDYDEFGITQTLVNNPTCSVGNSNQSTSSIFESFNICTVDPINKRGGANSHMGPQGRMVLPHVNASHTEQTYPPVDLSFPDFDSSVVLHPCNTPDNCVYNGQTAQYYGTLNNDTCDPQESAGTFNISYDGTCYRVGTFEYTNYRCLDEHTYAVSYFVGEGCQFLVMTSITTQICSSSNRYTYNCVAPPSAPNPPNVPPSLAPSNSNTPSTPVMEMPMTGFASSILPSSLLILSSLILLFF